MPLPILLGVSACPVEPFEVRHRHHVFHGCTVYGYRIRIKRHSPPGGASRCLTPNSPCSVPVLCSSPPVRRPRDERRALRMTTVSSETAELRAATAARPCASPCAVGGTGAPPTPTICPIQTCVPIGRASVPASRGARLCAGFSGTGNANARKTGTIPGLCFARLRPTLNAQGKSRWREGGRASPGRERTRPGERVTERGAMVVATRADVPYFTAIGAVRCWGW
jgi:hypothetical protein